MRIPQALFVYLQQGRVSSSLSVMFLHGIGSKSSRCSTSIAEMPSLGARVLHAEQHQHEPLQASWSLKYSSKFDAEYPRISCRSLSPSVIHSAANLEVSKLSISPGYHGNASCYSASKLLLWSHSLRKMEQSRRKGKACTLSKAAEEVSDPTWNACIARWLLASKRAGLLCDLTMPRKYQQGSCSH